MSAVVGALRAVLSFESAAFEKGINAAQKSLRAFDKRMQRIGGQFERVGQTLSVAVTAPIAGIAAATVAATRSLSELQNQANLAGVSAQQFKIMAIAAEDVGIEQDKLSDILKDVNDKMGEAVATGGGPLIDFFEKIAPKVGLTTDAFKGLSGKDALQLYVSSLEKAGVSQKEMTFYMEALASDSTALLPLLQNNGAALAAVAADAERLGLKIDDKLITSARSANREFRIVSEVLKVQFQQALVSLAPAMQALGDVMLPVLREAAGLINQVAEAFRSLEPATQSMVAKWTAVAAIIGPVLVGVGLAVSAIGTAASAISGIASILWGIVTAAAAAGAAIVGAVGLPVTLTVVAIGAAVTAIVAYWDEIKAGALAAGNYIKAEVMTWPDGFRAAWAAIKAEIATWPQAFIDTGRYIVEGLKQGIQEQWDAMVKWLSDKADAMSQSVRDAFGIHSPSRVMREIGGNIADGLRLGIEDGTPAAAAAMTGMADAVRGASSGIDGGLFDGVEDAARSAFKGVLLQGMSVADSLRQAFSNMLLNKANSLIDSAFSSIWSGIGGLFGFANGGAFANGRVTAFASGGVVTGPTVFPMRTGAGLMGEAGPEAIMPLTRMSNGKLGVASDGGNSQGVAIHVTASFDDEGNAIVRRVSQQSAAQVVSAYDAQMPNRVTQINRSPRKR